MDSLSTVELVLDTLADDTVVTPAAVGWYKEHCMMCFHLNRHRSGVVLKVVHGEQNLDCCVYWTGDVTDDMLRSYVDATELPNFGAIAIALLLVREVTEFTAVQQASIGTTIDYWLSSKACDDVLLFNHTARLEVSGILSESEGNSVDRRVSDKIRRLMPKNGLPAFIVVVEFSKPWSKMVLYEDGA